MDTTHTRQSLRREEQRQIHATIDKSLFPELISKFLTTEVCGRSLVCIDELESTNFSAKELAKAGYPHGTLVVCHHQVSGRGRQDKRWISIPGETVCMSLILRPSISAALVPRYTIAAALAITQMLPLYCMNDALIKWPNDIVYNGKKLAGILLEGSPDIGSERMKYVVVGIGVNVNTRAFFGDIEGSATSIYQCTGVEVLRERVIANIVNKIEPLLALCEDDIAFASLMNDYSRQSAVLYKPVRIVKRSGTYLGVVQDFDALGRILVRLDSGEERIFDSGDVSLRVSEGVGY